MEVFLALTNLRDIQIYVGRFFVGFFNVQDEPVSFDHLTAKAFGLKSDGVASLSQMFHRSCGSDHVPETLGPLDNQMQIPILSAPEMSSVSAKIAFGLSTMESLISLCVS